MTDPEIFDDSVVIRLLDHQVVDADGRFLGKVDDLALREDGDDLVVEALMIGPAALAPRYPGVLGRWGWAIWRRLNDPADPGVLLVPMREVLDVGSDIRVSDAAREALLASFGLENWLRRNLIGRIPGAKGKQHPSERGEAVPSWAERQTPPERGREGATHRLTELLTMTVRNQGGTPVGRITDVHGRAMQHAGLIRLTRVLHGPRLVGSSLGYSSPEQEGPRVIHGVVRALHRSARWREFSDLGEVSWARNTAELRHDR